VVKYCDDMEERVKPLLVKKEPLSEADMEKFGKKDPEAYPFYNQMLTILSLCVK
jgi:hypothetical protein